MKQIRVMWTVLFSILVTLSLSGCQNPGISDIGGALEESATAGYGTVHPGGTPEVGSTTEAPQDTPQAPTGVTETTPEADTPNTEPSNGASKAEAEAIGAVSGDCNAL